MARHEYDWWIQSLVVEDPFVDPVSLYSLPLVDVYELWIASGTANMIINELNKE